MGGVSGWYPPHGVPVAHEVACAAPGMAVTGAAMCHPCNMARSEPDTLRLVTAFYGGNARLPFEAGAALALVELIVASRRSRGEGPRIPGFDWLDPLVAALPAPLPAVHLDVIAGASAGGIVGAVLAKMLTDSDNPLDDFRQGSAVWVDDMGADAMQATELPRTAGDPGALYDKRRFTTTRMAAMMASNRTDTPIEPGCELWLSLTRAIGVLDRFPDPTGTGEAIADLRHLDVRHFDRIDFRTRPDAITDAIEATSASPLAFAPHFITDPETPEAHAAYLRARAPLDPTIAGDVPDFGPPARMPAYDGGALDNRPTGSVVDAALRRGLGCRPGERLVAVLIDPTPSAVPDLHAEPTPLGRVDGTLRRHPAFADQLHGLTAAARNLLHERVTEDLYRLVDWQTRACLIAGAGFSDEPLGERTLAAAVDRLLFGRLLTPDPALPLDRPGLVRTLAARDHDARRPILAVALRLRALTAMRARVRAERAQAERSQAERARAPHPQDFDLELDRITRLLALETTALNTLVDPDARPTPQQLRHLALEAAAGIPLPRPDGPRRVDVAIRRLGPPTEGLASWALNGMSGFLQRTYRGHDLITGLVRGRMIVADLLPPAARDHWRAAFALPPHDGFGAMPDVDAPSDAPGAPDPLEAAIAWFDRTPAPLPWNRWVADWRAVRQWQGPGWTQLDLRDRLDRELRRLQPSAARAVAHAADRIWHLAASASPERDNPLYRLLRGPLGFLARYIIAPLSRRAAEAEPSADWLGDITRTAARVTLAVLAWLALVAALAATALGMPLLDVLVVAALTTATGVALPIAALTWHRRRVAEVPHVAPARPATPPATAPPPFEP